MIVEVLIVEFMPTSSLDEEGETSETGLDGKLLVQRTEGIHFLAAWLYSHSLPSWSSRIHFESSLLNDTRLSLSKSSGSSGKGTLLAIAARKLRRSI